MKRGDKTLKFLEILKDAALDTADLLDVFITSSYGASLNEIERKAENGQFRKRFNIEYQKLSKNNKKKINDRFHSMVNRLEKCGLLEKRKSNHSFTFKITKKGIKKISLIKNLQKKMGDFPIIDYKNKKSSRVTIIIFDIPERDRHKRAWLRHALVKMDFKIVQKSVWMGKVVVPRDFLSDLKDLKIINFVEIFEITKTGSLKLLTK